MVKHLNDSERLQMVIDWSKLSANAFAKQIGYERGQTIYNILRGGRKINMAIATSIVNAYDIISLNWLLTGVGQMIDMDGNNEHIINSSKNIEEWDKFVIPYYDIEISAGPISFFSDYPELPHSKIEIPFISDVDLAMPVFGDSMYPKIKNGDVVLLKEIHEKSVIMFGEIYLVITEDYRTLKYVRKGETKEEVLLVSENDRYDPVSMPLNNILHLFLYKGKFEKSQI